MIHSPDLRPLDLGDLLDRAFSLYRANFALFVGIVALLAVPETLLNILVVASEPTTTVVLGNGATVTTHQTTGAGVLFALITVVFSILTWGAMSLAISYRYLDRPITIAEAYTRVGAARFVTLAIAAVLAGAAILFTIFIVLLGVYLAIRWIFISQAVIIEGRSLFNSFGRSWELTRGSFWRTFGYVIVIVLIAGIIQGVVGAVVGAVLSLGSSTGSQSLGQAINAVIGIVVQPFAFTALTLLYYDQRIRKEGFDIQVLSDSLSQSRPL